MTSKKKRVKFLDLAGVEEAVAEVAAIAARSMADVRAGGGRSHVGVRFRPVDQGR